MVAQRELRVRLVAAPGRIEQTTAVRYRGRALTLHLGHGRTSEAPDTPA